MLRKSDGFLRPLGYGGRTRNFLKFLLVEGSLFELKGLAPLPFLKVAMMRLLLSAGLTMRLERFTALDFKVILTDSLVHLAFPST